MTEPRDAYRHFHPITTRWADNDAFGHINNAHYYAFFDTAVTAWLVARGLLHPTQGETVCFVVETGCRYLRPLAFPEPVTVGMRVEKLGTSSIRYGLAVFGAEGRRRRWGTSPMWPSAGRRGGRCRSRTRGGWSWGYWGRPPANPRAPSGRSPPAASARCCAA